MKQIIPILIFVLATAKGYSRCAESGLYFWPNKQTISQNSVFVIEGYATSQKIIEGLGSTYKVFLKSDQQKIKLIIQETLVGQYGLTQALLKPETDLSIGKEYELVIENLAELEKQVYRYDSTTRQMEKVKWTVTSGKDTEAPVWTEQPKYTDGSYIQAGCGPIVHANFAFSAYDKSEYLIKTTVKNNTTGLETTYYLIAEDNLIAVGHGMCSGAFEFEGSDTFAVEFSLFDASGNLTKWRAERIEFIKPG